MTSIGHIAVGGSGAVAPIGRIFFSRAGLSVALAELVLFVPVFAFALWPRRRAARDFQRNR